MVGSGCTPRVLLLEEEELNDPAPLFRDDEEDEIPKPLTKGENGPGESAPIAEEVAEDAEGVPEASVDPCARW